LDIDDDVLQAGADPLPTLADHLGRFCRAEGHEFWADAVSMYDDTLFDRVLAGKATTTFGFIAAEADVKHGF
jgi:hypothetical protein